MPAHIFINENGFIFLLYLIGTGLLIVGLDYIRLEIRRRRKCRRKQDKKTGRFI